tara:strand:- start:124 stop:411 length:288 start_codon:yes stop_codon:yes gene_type:complete
MKNIKKTIIGKSNINKKGNISSGDLSDKNTQRIFDNVYKQINDLSNSQKEGFENTEQTKGKVGNIRAVKKDSQEHILEVKTKDGWASVNLDLKED